MKRVESTLLMSFPYLIGGVIFFFGAGRLVSRGDGVGAVILGCSGTLALLMAIIHNRRQKAVQE